MSAWLWIVIAFVAALFVIGVTAMGAFASGAAREFLRDLRPGGPTPPVSNRMEDVSMEELFNIGERPENAYVEIPVADTWNRFKHRVPGLRRGA